MQRRIEGVVAMVAVMAVVGSAWLAGGQAGVTLQVTWGNLSDRVDIERFTVEVANDDGFFAESSLATGGGDLVQVDDVPPGDVRITAFVESTKPAGSEAAPAVRVAVGDPVTVGTSDVEVRLDYLQELLELDLTSTAETPDGLVSLEVDLIDLVGTWEAEGDTFEATYLAFGPDAAAAGIPYLLALHPDVDGAWPAGGVDVALSGWIGVVLPSGGVREVFVDRAVNVPEGGTTVDIDVFVDLVTPSSVIGDIALSGPGDPTIVDAYELQAEGVGPLTDGLVVTASVPGTSTDYTVAIDTPGEYRLSALVSFPNGFAELPDADPLLPGQGPGGLVVFGDGPTREDLDVRVGVLEAQAVVQGSYGLDDVDRVTLDARRTADGLLASASSDAAGLVALSGFAGDLEIVEETVTLLDDDGGNVRATSYARAPASPATATVDAEAETPIPDVVFDLHRAFVVFDPSEDPGFGPGAVVQNAVVTGTSEVRDAGGDLVETRSFQSQGPSDPRSAMVVSVIAEPGTYEVTAVADVDGAVWERAFTLEVVAAPESGDGAGTVLGPQDAEPADQTVSVSFSNVVNGPASTSILELPVAPLPPEGFAVAGQVFDIETTAQCADPGDAPGPCTIAVCFDLSGVDLGGVAPADLTVYRFDGSDWTALVDGGLSDPAIPEICGVTDVNSPFAVLFELPPADTDGDGVPDDEDLCPDDFDPDNADLDGDLLGDVCDPDDDGDGVDDDVDNCPTVANADQDDADEDGIGDACDEDDDEDGDGDGVADGVDLCPDTPDDALVDADGCSGEQRIDAACDGFLSPRRPLRYVLCVTREAWLAKRDGLITLREKRRIVRRAILTAWRH